MLVVPCLVLGLSPLIASAWAVKVFGNISFSYAGLWPIILLAILLAVGWLGGRPLFRLVERSFWSLNSLIVEPCYALAREGLQQLIERPLPEPCQKSAEADGALPPRAPPAFSFPRSRCWC